MTCLKSDEMVKTTAKTSRSKPPRLRGASAIPPWIAGLLIIGVFASAVPAQIAFQHPLELTQRDVKQLAERKAVVRKNSRFLGWKFARQSHQDTSKWTRQTGERIELRALGANPDSQLPGKASGTAFSNAGISKHPALPAGFIPTAVTSGDFNDDGKMDFAVSNGGDNTVYVFVGNGDGTFKVPEILYTQGQSPTWITSVRLRGNGHLDLAVTNGDSNTVEIFPGNGDGTFQSSSQISLPQIPTFILAADANKDGNQDLVVGLTIAWDMTQPQFEILLGNCSGGISGTLFPPAIYGDPDFPVPTGWIAAGDLNKDGYVDFVTTVTGGFFIPYLGSG